MKLTEVNEILLGNVDLSTGPRFKDLPDYTEDIKQALNQFNGLYNREHLGQTMSHVEFYEANPMFDYALSDFKPNDKVFKKELFYAMLCGTYVQTIPTELVALFVFTRRSCVSPNQMVSALDKTRMKKYLTQRYNHDPKYMKNLLNVIWGYDVNLVTKARLMVTNGNIVEVYIDNINDILLCNMDIRDILSDVNDVANLWYSKEKGIVIGDAEVPLRTLIQSFGIVKDDLDLREVFFRNES